MNTPGKRAGAGKTSAERRANSIYNTILKKVVVPLTGNDVTYLKDLADIGRIMFGVRFAGVYPADKIPRLNDLKRYAILNLDSSKEPGSHWVAIAKNGDNTYLYDSFGRRQTQIIKQLAFSGNGRIINTDLDSEQDIQENNCGARCLAWLSIFDNWGADLAKLI